MVRTHNTVSAKPIEGAHRGDPNLLSGLVQMLTGSQRIATGLRHDNIRVFPSLKGQNGAAAPMHVVEWELDAQTGFFVLTSHLAAKFQGEEIANVRVATAAALPAYTQLGAGAGATLTADAVGVLTVDGVNIVLNDRILVKDAVDPANNGIYTCTTEGTGGVAFVLTRATDHDVDAEVTNGDFVLVTEGDTLANKGFYISTLDPITVDTTEVTWSQFDYYPWVSYLVLVGDAAGF